MKKEVIKIEATVESVIYRNDDNGYAVLRMKSVSGDSLVAVGCVPNAGVGEYLMMSGVWGAHPTYGDQFQISGFERRLPAAEGAILDYLSSGTIRGIGRRTAEKIVERFGAETFSVIENDWERLTEIAGITPKKAEQMSKEFQMQNGISRLMEFLVSHELEPSLALTLYRMYGSAAPAVINQNPYILAETELGVPFYKADALALSMGFTSESDERIRAAVLYELSYNAEAGHTFIPREKLADVTSKLIGVDYDTADSVIYELVEDNSIIQEFICGVRACYLPFFYEAETFVADKLCCMIKSHIPLPLDYEETVSRIEDENNIKYAPLQRKAIIAAANNPIMLLTGGPGTGKTTVIRGMLSLFERMGLKTALAAPTGRAAKRMSEFCGVEAKTIHRLLEMGYDESHIGLPVFGRDSDNPLDIQVLILDEVSMVDILLMRAVLDALTQECKLILVGDADQLPSIGAGNVLKDLIGSEVIETVRLTEIFRQAAESSIITGAHSVNRGELPDFSKNDNDLFYLRKTKYNELIDSVLELCKTRLPDNMSIPTSQIQVLTVSRKHEAGTVILNRRLQEALNPASESKRERRLGDKLLRVGDRVMQVRNNYDLAWHSIMGGESGTGVFNGDIGEITGIDLQQEILTVRYDDRLVHYPFEMLGELELAYALTVHKAQGSEFRAVIFIALGGSAYLLHRSVLYTAMTRARELLLIVGDIGTVRTMVNNNKQRNRYSALRVRLKMNGCRQEHMNIETGMIR